MKTKSLLLAIAGFVLLSVQSFAQNVTTPSAPTSEAANSDYVTVGSRVPYYAAPDPTIKTMTDAGTMKASIFKWNVTTAADANMTVPLLEFDGSAGQQYNDFRVVTPATGFYDNEISVEWTVANGFAANTQYKVKVAEKTVTNSMTIAGCEDATPEVKDVFVLERPTVAFAATEGGGCGVAPGSAFDIPLTVQGLGNWEVTYTVSYNGGAASAPANYTLTLGAPAVTDATVIAQSQLDRNTAAGEGLSYTLPLAQYGYYDVTITNITDRISRKSLAALPASGASGTYRIYVTPTPTTQPIQHIRNL